jgi:hypothetical protein
MNELSREQAATRAWRQTLRCCSEAAAQMAENGHSRRVIRERVCAFPSIDCN